MKRKLKSTLLMAMLSLSWVVPAANAVMIEFSPQDQTVILGDQATVDVVLSDLGGEFVGTYDFFVNYDSGILSVADFVFGDSLGGATNSIQITDFADGSINATEVSLLFDLVGLQDGSSDFVLFSIVFDTLATGVSDLLFQENILGIAGGFLGDEFGAPLLADTSPGSIEVIDDVISIPEPSTLVLIFLGLAALSLSRKSC